MNEKRFTQKDEDDWEILDRNKHFAYAHSGYQANKIIHELNELVETNRELYKDNKQLKEHLSTWRSSCCNYLNVYSILDNEVSILKETKDLDRFFEKFDKYSRMPFYEVEKSFIELQKENEQLKFQNSNLMKEVAEYSRKAKELEKKVNSK